jgi:hypothetical protein
MSEQKWLKLDLQHFSDGFDLESFRQDFESSYEEPEETQEETETDEVETETDELETETEIEEEESEEEEIESDDESEEDNEEEDSEESTYVPPAKQTKEENAAFAKLRREKEELAAQASVLQKVAAQYNMSVEEFQKAYEEEFFKKFNDTEQRLLQVEKQAANDKFNVEVEAVKTKYGLDDAEIGKVYDYIGTQGLHDARLGLPTIPFEAAYKALNFDNMMERKTTEAKQKMLADKKKRQKSSAKAHSNTNASTANNDEVTDEYVEKRLRERGLI